MQANYCPNLDMFVLGNLAREKFGVYFKGILNIWHCF